MPNCNFDCSHQKNGKCELNKVKDSLVISSLAKENSDIDCFYFHPL